ncbi:Suppressor of the cold-sensitive snRNP bioproteinsis mutant brr1-1, partial [Perkinsus olseni]
VQVIDTASINCNATQEEICQYLKDASGSLDIEALCEPNYAWEREQGTDYLNRQLSAATPSPTPFVKPPPTAVVNVDDPLAVYQHYLQTIGFDISVESQASVANSSGTPLQNVVVAIVDSGTDESHEDLHTSIYTDENGKTIGYDFFDNDPIPDDVFGHGTHLAGIISAKANNSIGIAGISEAKIMPLKVFGGASTSTSTARIVSAVEYALSNGAQVVLIVSTATVRSAIFKSALQEAVAEGAMVVTSAGSEGKDISKNKIYPCAFAEEVDMLC